MIAASARLAKLAEPSPHALELYTACVAKASELAAHDELRPDPMTIWPDATSE